VRFLQVNRHRLVSTRDVANAADLNDKATPIALQLLRVLGLVRRSKGPLPNGAGGHRDRWQWVGKSTSHSLDSDEPSRPATG
jgi:hypothetical protein